jgi:hypothetical protein
MPLKADAPDKSPLSVSGHHEAVEVLFDAFGREVYGREQRQQFGQIGTSGAGDTNVVHNLHPSP